MNPVISQIADNEGILEFTLSGVNVSLANAIRRTILSDIPTLVFNTEIYNDNQCKIQTNTTRLHNEILKQRLSCVPIHMKELDVLPDNYILVLDVKNDTENMVIVTTEDFRIKNKQNEKFLTLDEVHKIFPPNIKTGMYIDFARLRAKISETIPGEHLQLTCEFSVHTAKENCMYNVVSKCSYGNTIDITKANSVWEEQEAKLKTDELSGEDIEFHKRNFYLLDAQRYFVPDSFDFAVKTVGVFENQEIVKKACTILHDKFIDFIQAIDAESISVHNSETTIDNCFDITLENEDYTMGKLIEYVLYEKLFIKDKTLTFCGFKKFHPHSSDSVIRVAYKTAVDKNTIKQHLRVACIEITEVLKKLQTMF